MSSSSTQASVLRCFCPDITAYADAAVVQQARTFANCLLQHPPIPEFAEWAESQQRSSQQSTDTQQQPQDPTTDSSTPLTQQQQQQNPQAYDTLVKVWLIWVMNGHKFKLGSALFDYGSKLTHTCACPNTMYRTATGDIAAVVETVDGSSSGSAGSSSSLRQPPPAGAGAGADADAHAAGVHVALSPIATGDLLTTNYLGMGHKRVMSTPARQKHLQDKFLFKCTCSRCVCSACCRHKGQHAALYCVICALQCSPESSTGINVGPPIVPLPACITALAYKSVYTGSIRAPEAPTGIDKHLPSWPEHLVCCPAAQVHAGC